MADPVRLTPVRREAVAILGAGAFGTRVSEILAASRAACQQFGTSAITTAFTSDFAAIVVALWRPEPSLCERADELSFQRGRPWLPVIMEHPVIRIGPLVVPPASPCFRCYLRRRAQHDGQRWVTAVLRAARGTDEACGPAGYLPNQARMAAAVANAMLPGGPAPAEAATAGQVTTIRLLHGSLATNRVLACHGCPRCGTDRPPGELGWLAGHALRSPAAMTGAGAAGQVSVR